LESPESLQRRIKTLAELQTIVRTMKALSAVSIRQYDAAVTSLAQYYRTVELGLQVVMRDTFEFPADPAHTSGSSMRAAVVFGTDHGLCGHFNEDIAAFAAERMARAAGARDQLRLLAVGARVAADLAQSGYAADSELAVPGSAEHIAATVQRIVSTIDEWRSTANVRFVYLLHNRQSNAGGYEPVAIELLPVNLRQFQPLEAKPWPSRRLPTYTMAQEQLLAALLRQYFFVSIFRACAQSQASEHASRLAAMQGAEKHLDQKREEIQGHIRRLRQETITTELLEVVSGYDIVMNEPGR
jgi:F-type H+-transporting ATPase subunit gamma